MGNHSTSLLFLVFSCHTYEASNVCKSHPLSGQTQIPFDKFVAPKKRSKSSKAPTKKLGLLSTSGAEELSQSSGAGATAASVKEPPQNGQGSAASAAASVEGDSGIAAAAGSTGRVAATAQQQRRRSARNKK